eukprot:11972814-Heterocapsa_arctica.AAC.2
MQRAQMNKHKKNENKKARLTDIGSVREKADKINKRSQDQKGSKDKSQIGIPTGGISTEVTTCNADNTNGEKYNNSKRSVEEKDQKETKTKQART